MTTACWRWWASRELCKWWVWHGVIVARLQSQFSQEYYLVVIMAAGISARGLLGGGKWWEVTLL